MDAKLQVKKYLHQKAQRLAEPRLDYPKMEQKEVIFDKETQPIDAVRRIPDPELVQHLKNLISGGGVLQRQIAEAVNIRQVMRYSIVFQLRSCCCDSQTKMSQFLKGAERKRGWKTLERNLHNWVSKNTDKNSLKLNQPINNGKTDSDSASPPKIPNVYQIQREQSSEDKSDVSSEESIDDIDECTNNGTCPQSPAGPNPNYNCWTKTNCSSVGSIHDSILGMTPSEDATGFHSWESFSLNDMFS